MDCAVICLGQQRRNFGSEILVFHQVFSVPGVEHYLFQPLLRDILRDILLYE